MENIIFGRDKEIDLLKKAIDGLKKGNSSFRFLQGPIGVGKTTLLNFAGCYFGESQSEGRSVYFQFLPANDSDDKYGAWCSILSQLLSSVSTDEKKSGSVLKKFFGSKEKAIDIASEIMGVIPGMEIATAAVKIGMILKSDNQEPQDFQDKLKKYSDNPIDFYSDFVISYSVKSPVLILLDDIHWGNPASINVINAILMKITSQKVNSRLCLVGANRTAESSSKTTGLEALETIIKTIGKRYTKNEFVKVINVDPLAKKYIFDIINFELNQCSGLSNDSLEWIFLKSSGSPFMALKIIEILKNEEVIYMNDGKYLMREELSRDGNDFECKGELLRLVKSGVFDDVEMLFADGLNTLSQEEIVMLKHASVQGAQFNSAALSFSIERKEEDILEILYVLSKKEFIKLLGETQVGFNTAQKFSFTSNNFYNAIKNQLLSVQKRLISLKLGQWYESIFDKILDAVSESDIDIDSASQSKIILEKGLEEICEQAVLFHKNAENPFQALNVYLQYLEFMVAKDAFLESKDTFHLRDKIFNICDKVDFLLSDSKKSPSRIKDLKWGLKLEARAFLIKGKIFQNLQIYNEAINNLMFAEKIACWISENKISADITFEIINTYLLSGMYEKARKEYYGILNYIKSLQDEKLLEDTVSQILKIIYYEEEEIKNYFLDELISYVKSRSNNFLTLSKLFIAKTLNLMDEQNLPINAKLSEDLMRIINPSNSDSIFNILLNDYYYDVTAIGGPYDIDSITDYGDDFDSSINESSAEQVESSLRTVESVFNVFENLKNYFPQRYIEVELSYYKDLLNARGTIIDIIEKLKNNKIHNYLSKKEREKLISEFNQLITESGILCRSKIENIVKKYLYDSVPAAAVDEWCALMNNVLIYDFLEADEDRLILAKKLSSTCLSRNKYYKGISVFFNVSVEDDKINEKNVNYAIELLSEYDAFLELEDKMTLKDLVGYAKSRLGQYEESFNFYLAAMNIAIELEDYSSFTDMYKIVKSEAKKAGNLPAYAEIINLYKKMESKIKKIEESTALNEPIDYGDIQYFALSLKEKADNSEDIEERFDCYKRAIELLQKNPHGEAAIDDIYEEMANIYKAEQDDYIMNLDEDEEADDNKVQNLIDKAISCLDNALLINKKLQDYNRIMEINDKKLEILSKDCEDEWIKTFLEAKDIALKSGSILTLCDLFLKVVPEYDPKFPDEYLDKDVDIEDSYDYLPSDLLLEFYKEFIEFLTKKNLVKLREKVIAGMIRFSERTDDPLLKKALAN